ncbi:GNAT family N-acetyltransferase [Phyllobacterium sp. 628]|uniref:GNAT family N-acetyltransferase n=1 Tax=Phyllobacterium sp. 628 TaxID=2718938 RepID=UPI00166256CE|nr:GNAT family N-acetyltransferase [Phyllobacterium sp. 628]QND51470.1 GNAT family N-acetyltransferase [Phyllobacterium sp. 628]
MTFTLRSAQPADALDLAALSIQVWLHTYAKSGIRGHLSRYVFDAFTQEKLAAEIADATKHLILCEVDECLVGFVKIGLPAHCPIRQINTPEIETLYVQAHFAGHGIGSALLRAAMDHCRERGWSDVFLLVNLENSRARQFYESKAFDRIGTVDFVLEDERHANAVLVKKL